MLIWKVGQNARVRLRGVSFRAGMGGGRCWITVLVVVVVGGTEGDQDCEKRLSMILHRHNKNSYMEEVRSCVLLGRRRIIERPDPCGGIVRVDSGICHEPAFLVG